MVDTNGIKKRYIFNANNMKGLRYAVNCARSVKSNTAYISYNVFSGRIIVDFGGWKTNDTSLIRVATLAGYETRQDIADMVTRAVNAIAFGYSNHYRG